jgi:hypothetical protein
MFVLGAAQTKKNTATGVPVANGKVVLFQSEKQLARARSKFCDPMQSFACVDGAEKTGV